VYLYLIYFVLYYQKIHACRNPCLADKTIVFSEHGIFKVVVMDISTNEKSLKISLLITTLSISQTYIC
jgi:hypothetical protein